jgi:hypothetical protein
MKKYNEEYFSVRERRTGRKICDCGDFQDARMVMRLDIPNREIVKNKVLMSPVVDIEIPKALPTTEVVVVDTVHPEKFDEYVDNLLELKQYKLPEGEGKPVKV